MLFLKRTKQNHLMDKKTTSLIALYDQVDQLYHAVKKGHELLTAELKKLTSELQLLEKHVPEGPPFRNKILAVLKDAGEELPTREICVRMRGMYPGTTIQTVSDQIKRISQIVRKEHEKPGGLIYRSGRKSFGGRDMYGLVEWLDRPDHITEDWMN